MRIYIKKYLAFGVSVFVAALYLVTWSSEESRFIRFTKEFGVDVDSHFTSDFVSSNDLSLFISNRGYENPFMYFEEALGLRPGVDRLSDPKLSPSNRDLLISKGADMLTVYGLTRGFIIGSVERRILIYQNNDKIIEMTSRTFSTGL